MFSKKRNNVTILLVTLLLLSYAGILITNNYTSQLELQKVTLFQMRQSLEKREEMTNQRQMKDQELSTKRDI